MINKPSPKKTFLINNSNIIQKKSPLNEMMMAKPKKINISSMFASSPSSRQFSTSKTKSFFSKTNFESQLAETKSVSSSSSSPSSSSSSSTTHASVSISNMMTSSSFATSSVATNHHHNNSSKNGSLFVRFEEEQQYEGRNGRNYQLDGSSLGSSSSSGISPPSIVGSNFFTHNLLQQQQQQQQQQQSKLFDLSSSYASAVPPPSSSSAAFTAASTSTNSSSQHQQQQQQQQQQQPYPEIMEFAKKKPTGVSLKQLIDFGSHVDKNKLKKSAQFLLGELPIRLAHQYKRLYFAPFGLSNVPSLIRIRELYASSFFKLRSAFPSTSPNAVFVFETQEQERRFTQLIEEIYERHSDLLVTLAHGINEFKKSFKASSSSSKKEKITNTSSSLSSSDMEGKSDEEILNLEIHTFLNSLLLFRIGIRLLLGQHIGLHNPSPAGQIGIVQKDCDPAQVARHAFYNAMDLFLMTYGVAPDLEIVGKVDAKFPYVESHLQLMLFELIKNSMRAIIETHALEKDGKTINHEKKLPPIRIVISEGEEDVCIKVSDEGGGIPRSAMEKIFTYMYTTAPTRQFSDDDNDEEDNDDDDAARLKQEGAILSGFGYGLPICKVYAQYFGGNLKIISMEGYGTDAYLYLSKLDSHEAIPGGRRLRV